MGTDKIRMNKNIFFSCLFFILNASVAFSQQNKVTLGAYYFDGWTGVYPYHITPLLKDSFASREPIWGWVTSQQEIVDEQIKTASSAGIDFFSFCWYNVKKEGSFKNEPLNHALNLFLQSPYKGKLRYCLLIANHAGSEIGPADWHSVMEEWISLFKDKQYLLVDGKPLIVFFSVNSLITKFGSESNVKAAFDSLKLFAIKNGLEGVTIAVTSGPDSLSLSKVYNCGFDVITGYNYHDVGFGTSKNREVLITNLQDGEQRVWNNFAARSKLPYIPVVTLNWDPRPWTNKNNNYDKAPFYVGFSEKSVYTSVSNSLNWIKTHPSMATKEKIILLYAWNENGEGAYLTPSKNGDNFLNGVKKVLKNKD